MKKEQSRYNNRHKVINQVATHLGHILQELVPVSLYHLEHHVILNVLYEGQHALP